MRDALAKALADGDAAGRGRGAANDEARDDASVDRILAAAFFRKRPLQAGSVPCVIRLDERRGGGPRR